MEPYQWAIILKPAIALGFIWLVSRFTEKVIRPRMKEGRLKRILFFSWD